MANGEIFDVTVIGTYIPLFPLNNLFGQIPIIGLALGAPVVTAVIVYLLTRAGG